jgi:hypothetical protein
MQVTEGHLFSQMSFCDVEDTDERLILELDTVRSWSTGAVRYRAASSRHSSTSPPGGWRTGHDVTTADMTVHFLAGKTPVDHRCRRHRHRPVTGSPPLRGARAPLVGGTPRIVGLPG